MKIEPDAALRAARPARLSPSLRAHHTLNGRYHIDPDQPPRHRAQPQTPYEDWV